MPQPLPPDASPWDVEDNYLWLGSIGWYGVEKVKEYTDRLRRHRETAPLAPAGLTPVELDFIRRQDASADAVGAINPYYQVLQWLDLAFPGLVRWIDEAAPQRVRDRVRYLSAALWFVSTSAVRARAARIAGSVPAQRISGVVPAKGAITPAQLVAAGAALLPSVLAPQIKPGASWLERKAAALFGATR